MRTSSFDREEARRAWRAVARMRGSARGPRGGRGGPASPGWILAGVVLAALGVLGVAELASDDEGPEPKPPPDAKAVAREANAPTRPGSATPPTASSWISKRAGERSTRPAAVAEHGDRDETPQPANAAADTVARPRTQAAALRRPHARRVPEGTPVPMAEALARVPVSPRDRAPIGEIAPTGLHVDRIALGTDWERARCGGTRDGFTVGRDRTVHVCIRVVHLRQRERLMVRWEKDGRLVRRTRLRIPPRHAFRTRAGLRLRTGYEGRWRVRIVSESRELATAGFTVDA